MNKRTVVTSAITTAAVVAALIATPTLAAVARPSDTPEPGQAIHTSQPYAQGEGRGSMGQKMDGPHADGQHAGGQNTAGQTMGGQKMGGGNGPGDGTGGGSGLTDVASGTLTDDQKTELAAMAEEEKLAQDLYVAFDAQYDATVFTRIAKSETKHLDAVRTLLERYELTDPTLGLAAGEFLTDETQARYDTLLADGSVSLDAAMEAGRTVEETDIADLTTATEGVTAPDVLKVYERLLAASEKHLVAFGG
ncbi:MAG TPA: DUF2202 domain-containing protein [Cryobacterium sp.]|nr:DUF2202 domain-containing protein [Cryobacterium sp.]